MRIIYGFPLDAGGFRRSKHEEEEEGVVRRKEKEMDSGRVRRRRGKLL